MEPDDKLCLCFHVTQRKVQNYIRIEKPRRVAQLSECFGAGTGCGWCRPFLQALFEQMTSEKDAALPSAKDYAAMRAKYVQAGKGAPPPNATHLPADGEDIA